ncbi:uncharacterized protein LOC131469882 [Solea solea]|uniref:uncharacterized protein LOC131469882 n=1 Tax=Solea solea TaxID=90069 RepID=UPI00272C9278|nr:uncharacterized protein LOC131469882 [Solea solea]XP_058501275.1 uncharacterized protein LOC131469882 [Solea solea]
MADGHQTLTCAESQGSGRGRSPRLRIGSLLFADDVVSFASSGRDLQLQEPDVVTCVPGTQTRSGAEREAGREAGRQAGREAGRQAGRQAGREAGREAGRQAGREAGREAGRQAGREPGRQAGRQACQVLPPWREARALLSALPGKTTVSDQDRRPTEARRRIDFMDFFRDTLEASLEASSRSTAPSQRQRQRRTCGCSSPSSPPRVNYVKMQKRIEELEEQLLYLTGREQDALTSPVPNVAAVKPNQDLRLPGPAPKEEEEEESEWMKPLSPSQDDLHDNDEDADLAKDASSSKPVQFHAPPSEPRRPNRRFIKSWLCMFPFLRYSPTRDLMWCHVCRLYADKQFQKLGLIKGSRVFKMQNIRKHSESRYHNDSLHIYELHTQAGAATSVVGF